MMSAMHNRQVFGESASVSKIQFINCPGKQSGRAHWPRSQKSFGLHAFVLVLHLN